MIYDYLFYKTYKLAKLLKNDNGDAIWLGIMIVGSCLVFNIATILLFIDAIGSSKYSSFDNDYKYIIGTFMTLAVGFYFVYKKRYKEILKKYERRAKDKRSVHPIVPVLVFCITSIMLLILSAMYKNGDGIFA